MHILCGTAPSATSAPRGLAAPHDLRRTNATGLVRSDVDIKTAQKRLGHSDPRLTIGVYAQATEAADRDAATALSSRFRPGQSARIRPARGLFADSRPTPSVHRRKKRAVTR
ncbi:MAG: tyrosine-type recombinase/integrase [Acidimicrobiales bacterium]